MWRSASLPALPVCASSRCGAAGRCCCSRRKTRCQLCASAWKALRQPRRSPLPPCRCKSLPPHHSGWTPPPTGCASPRPSKSNTPSCWSWTHSSACTGSMKTTPLKSLRCSRIYGNSNASFNWPSCWFATPAKTPNPAAPDRPCAVPANSTAGATPISTCAAKVPN